MNALSELFCMLRAALQWWFIQMGLNKGGGFVDARLKRPGECECVRECVRAGHGPRGGPAALFRELLHPPCVYVGAGGGGRAPHRAPPARLGRGHAPKPQPEIE